MSSVTPSISGDLENKVKEKTRPTNNGTKEGFASPLYGAIPEMFEGDGIRSFITKEFAQILVWTQNKLKCLEIKLRKKS